METKLGFDTRKDGRTHARGGPVPTQTMPIECVAVIGKKNNPLYLSTFPPNNSTDVQHRFQLVVYSSLDVIDTLVKKNESGASGGDGGSKTTENGSGGAGDGKEFLGYLCSVEHFKIFGYVTNTSIKFILVVSDEVDRLKTPYRKVQNFLSSMHSLYIEAIYNPFYTLETPITSKGFAGKVNALVGQSEKQWF